jgi:hypothetical protein
MLHDIIHLYCIKKRTLKIKRNLKNCLASHDKFKDDRLADVSATCSEDHHISIGATSNFVSSYSPRMS